MKRTATFGKAGELGDMLCVCHSPYEHLCYTGSSTGEIYVFQGSTFRKRMPAHKGPVYAMFALLQSDDKVNHWFTFIDLSTSNVFPFYSSFFRTLSSLCYIATVNEARKLPDHQPIVLRCFLYFRVSVTGVILTWI